MKDLPKEYIMAWVAIVAGMLLSSVIAVWTMTSGRLEVTGASLAGGGSIFAIAFGLTWVAIKLLESGVQKRVEKKYDDAVDAWRPDATEQWQSRFSTWLSTHEDRIRACVDRAEALQVKQEAQNRALAALDGRLHGLETQAAALAAPRDSENR